MQIPSFEKRLEPPRTLGIPDPCFFYGVTACLFMTFGFLVPVLFLKIVLLTTATGILYLVYQYWVVYPDWFLVKAKESGVAGKNMPTFGKIKNILSDRYCWKTYVGDSAISHHDNAISIAFEWKGTQNRFFDYSDFAAEHRSRLALLNILSQQKGVCIENHFYRIHDDSLADAYIQEGEIMNPDAPLIVKDIRKQVADLYRPLAQCNYVLSVISIGSARQESFLENILSFIKPATGRRIKDSTLLMEEIMNIFSEIKPNFPGARLLDKDEYSARIQMTRAPYENTFELDWRHEFADQLIDKAVGEEKGCLRLEDTFYKVCLINSYPDLDGFTWFFSLCDAPEVDMHISQIIIPKSADKALDDSQSSADYQSKTISDKKGTQRAIKRIRHTNEYQMYIAEHDLPVADNAYIVTFYSKDIELVKKYASKLKTSILAGGGKVRDDLDLQRDMFDVRLPGMGRYSRFLREDHGDVIASMMPFTTSYHGSLRPECLRITDYGQLVGFSPSKLEVAHEAVISETYGGKDTQYGLKFFETYSRIRYDIVELGNSYQGPVEAVDGHYCRAREQVINPMSPYSELNAARNLSDEKDNVYASIMTSLANVLLPVFKGFKEGIEYTRPEEVIMGRALDWCYTNPIDDSEAPTLPDLLESFGHVEAEMERYEDALVGLRDELEDFLKTPTGECFKNKDQFIISPIANAIDFLGLEGDLFNFSITFIIMRLASSAMARGKRSQIVLNEYKVLLETAPQAIKHITWMIDRMGRKDWVGLTRISQDFEEIQIVDKGAVNSIPNVTLLSRTDRHKEIGEVFRLPQSAIAEWQNFAKPDDGEGLDYREGFVRESGRWYKLYLKFPKLLLDMMNTRGKDKKFREMAFKSSKDPYERIKILNEQIKGRDNHENIKQTSVGVSAPLL